MKFICTFIINALHAGSTQFASYSKKARFFIFIFCNVNGMDTRSFLLCTVNFLEQYDSIIVHSFIYTYACRPTWAILLNIANNLYVTNPVVISKEFIESEK